MKNAVLSAMVAILAFSGMAEAETKVFVAEFAISGYEEGDSAFRAEQEIQLIIQLNPIKEKYSRGEGLVFLLEGSADAKGVSARNTMLAAERARNVESFIKNQFPKAKVESLSRGDQENIRQVKVSCDLYPDLASAPALPAPNNNLSVILALILATISSLFIVYGIRLAPKRQKQPKSEIALWQVAPKEEIKGVRARYKDGWIIVPIMYENRGTTVARWYTPFIDVKNGKVLSGENRKNAKKRITQCAKDPEYEKEIIRLIEKRVIEFEKD